MSSHSERIDRLRAGYREAHARFVKRLTDAPADALARVPAEGGWSAAQIGWHVAAVDAAFAGILSGDVPGAKEVPEGQAVKPWSEIVSGIPGRMEAGKRVQPPPSPARDEVLAALAASAGKLDAALSALPEDRGARYAIVHPVVGTVVLADVGEWAIAHPIRHNAQSKRVLGF